MMTLFFPLTALMPPAGNTAMEEEKTKPRAMAFQLEDQFGRTLAYRFPKKKVSVLTFGDWKGSSQIEGWVRPIYERYKGTIDIHGVAVLDIVPSFAQDFARSQFRERVKYPVLLDFEGDVAKGYDFVDDNANIIVISPDGIITYRVVGEASKTALQRVFTEIDRLVKE
jgi:hypothetical protein